VINEIKVLESMQLDDKKKYTNKHKRVVYMHLDKNTNTRIRDETKNQMKMYFNSLTMPNTVKGNSVDD
jgi:hypothetical protein